MIILTNNRMPERRHVSTASQNFQLASNYFEMVADLSSDARDWEHLRLYRTSECSNDLSFARICRNTLTLELTGTAKHVSVLDGKRFERRTAENEICQMPEGIAARFVWDILGDKQHSLILQFDVKLFEKYCPEFATGGFLAGHLAPADFGARPEMAYLMRLLSRELEPGNRRGRLFADTVIRLLAIEIGQSAWTRKLLTGNGTNVADRKIRLALDFIEQNYGTDITLEDLSRESGLNASQLIASFRKHVGATPYAHVVNRRLQQAVHLLRTSELAIAQIALEVGFSDQQQMSHAFRRRLGKTPGSFRRE